jgi:hypothetical protein
MGITSAWLKAWDSQGTHRTATAGDHAGAEWLASEASALGASVTIEEFRLERLDPAAAFLQIGEAVIEGVPVFDAPVTGTDGIAGVLGKTIAVQEFSPRAVYDPAYRTFREAEDHDALVIVCQGEHPGLGLLNAEQFREPYGAPAIHVSSEDRDRVLAAAARGARARLIADSRHAPARARNVVVTLPGRDPARRPVVVMTPRSSWWQSTSERGGGIVCWLETLRALLAEPPAGDVILTANSGHELGHLGLDDFIVRRPGWDQPDGAVWVHYGANIGAAGGSLSVMSADGALRDGMQGALARPGVPPPVMAPTSMVPSGETRDIHRAGGRYVTLVGTNPLFHLPQDRWPHDVDVPMIERIAAAAARLAVELTR